MSVQASLNIAGPVSNTKPNGNVDALSGVNKISEGNQLFSGILNSVSEDNVNSLALASEDLVEGETEFVGPLPLDNGDKGFFSEANIDDLEGKLLPLLPGAISNLALATDSSSIQAGLKEQVELVTAVPALVGSNTVLEQLRGLLAGASAEGDSEELVELRTRLLAVLDNKQSNVNSAADQVLRNPVLSSQVQNDLRQEVGITLSNVRAVFSDYIDRVERIERTRGTDFFDLNQSFFEPVQKKSTGLDELLATLTKTSPSAATNSVNTNINPILAQIASLISGNTAITQPLLGVVADTSSLQPSNPTQTQIAAPLNSSQWSEELGQRVRWLVGQNINAAQIRLNPAALGPVELRINVAGDQVSVAFNSQFGAVREAIESALPKLREMLESQGLNLAEADINQGDTAEKQGKDRENGANNNELAADTVVNSEGELLADVSVTQRIKTGLVDQFV